MRRFLIRLKRTISFLPTIWKGADWDYRYAVDLFTYQLSRTADYIESKGRHTTAQSDVIRMRTAIALLNKVYEEEYGMEYMDEIESKYGKSSIDFVESNVGVSQIKRWNELTNDNLKVGQRLTIYPTKPIVAESVSRKDNGGLYIVKKGDSLWSISQNFPGVSIQNIKKWNDISSNNLKPGMKLKVSKG